MPEPKLKDKTEKDIIKISSGTQELTKIKIKGTANNLVLR
jgi:hypothetical protein